MVYKVASLHKHTAAAASRVVNLYNLGQVVEHGFEHHLRKQVNDVARREVLTCLLVVLLVEAAQQFLEDCAHVDVAHCRERQAVGVFDGLVGEVDKRVGDFFDER